MGAYKCSILTEKESIVKPAERHKHTQNQPKYTKTKH
jgi:hypothetical protein